MGRAGNDALAGALDLLQLGHEIRLGMQAPGGVGDHAVHVAGLGSAESVKDHRAGVSAGLLFHHFDPQASSPNLKLLVGRGAERIRSAEQGLAVLLEVEVGELGNAGGFAYTVHPHHKNNFWQAPRRLFRSLAGGGRARLRRISAGAFQEGQDFLLNRGAQLLGFAKLTMIDALAQASQNFLRRLDAQVSADQRGLQAVEDARVNRFPAFDNLVDALHQLRLGGRDGLLEPVKETRLFLRRTKQRLNHASAPNVKSQRPAVPRVILRAGRIFFCFPADSKRNASRRRYVSPCTEFTLCSFLKRVKGLRAIPRGANRLSLTGRTSDVTYNPILSQRAGGA